MGTWAASVVFESLLFTAKLGRWVLGRLRLAFEDPSSLNQKSRSVRADVSCLPGSLTPPETVRDLGSRDPTTTGWDFDPLRRALARAWSRHPKSLRLMAAGTGVVCGRLALANFLASHRGMIRRLRPRYAGGARPGSPPLEGPMVRNPSSLRPGGPARRTDLWETQWGQLNRSPVAHPLRGWAACGWGCFGALLPSGNARPCLPPGGDALLFCG